MVARTTNVFLLLLALAPTPWAWQLPFQLPFSSPTFDEGSIETGVKDATSRPVRIAIIGAGAGGSSAAFWVSQAQRRHSAKIHVDVFEKSDYVGGRSTIVHPYDDPSLLNVELGASIFVDANRNLMRAVKEFNLTLRGFRESDDDDMGIWDGKQFVLATTNGGWFSWLNNLKVLWRYGYTSCTRAPKLVAALVNKYLDIYTPSVASWPSVESLSKAFGWESFTSQTGEAYLFSQGIGELFTHELFEAFTRVNYGQNSDALHALMGVVGMATNGASSVDGGNYQIFENFLAASNASVHLNTTVTGLRKSATTNATPQWFLSTSPPPKGQPLAPYDHVIVAAPFTSSLITILGSPASFEPAVDYVHLHVTLLTTTAPRLNPTFFGLRPSDTVPTLILTSYNGARNGGVEPDFNSLNYLDIVRPKDHPDGPEWAVKIFSQAPISDEWLASAFGNDTVGWVHRKEWDAYPKGVPTSEFPPVNPDTGLWYINAFEPFISTMETETLASRNVVNNLFEAQYGSGLCGPRSKVSEDETVVDDKDGWGGTGADGKIWGWDC